jgi:hypothetical protein
MHQGRIQTEQAPVDSFTAGGVELGNGKHVKADIVILGTGWEYDHAFLPADLRDLIEDDGIYLYRHVLHPNCPRLVFVGLASTFSNSLSDYLEVRWLVALLKGEISLPDRALMLDEIEAMKQWKKKDHAGAAVKGFRASGSCIALPR